MAASVGQPDEGLSLRAVLVWYPKIAWSLGCVDAQVSPVCSVVCDVRAAITRYACERLSAMKNGEQSYRAVGGEIKSEVGRSSGMGGTQDCIEVGSLRAFVISPKGQHKHTFLALAIILLAERRQCFGRNGERKEREHSVILKQAADKDQQPARSVPALVCRPLAPGNAPLHEIKIIAQSHSTISDPPSLSSQTKCCRCCSGKRYV